MLSNNSRRFTKTIHVIKLLKEKEMFILRLTFLCLFVNFIYCVNVEQTVQKRDPKIIAPPIVLKLDANQIVDTLKTVMNSQFIQTMANDIASKAVKNFVKEIKLKEKQKLQSMQTTVVNERLVPQSSVLQSSTNVAHDEREKGKQKANYQPPAEQGQYQVTVDQPLDQRVSLDLKEDDDDKKKNPTGLDEQIAYALLRDPSPDGDNLGLDSLEPPVTIKAMPKKINGIYMRRLLEPIVLTVDSSEETPVKYRRTLQ